MADPLIEQLTGRDPDGRKAAAGRLGQLQTAEARKALEAALSDPRADVRINAAEALAHHGEAAITALTTCLDDSQVSVQQVAARSLGQIGHARAVPALLAVLSSDDDRVVRAAVRALGQIGDPLALPDLIDLLPGAGTSLKQQIVEALGAIGGDIVPPSIIPLLDDPAWPVRQSAALALGQTGAVEARDALHRVAANDPKRHVRIAAQSALEALS
ncbi:MAG: HEAT repeat domain-containing protein [Anaerolineae bacterium]